MSPPTLAAVALAAATLAAAPSPAPLPADGLCPELGSVAIFPGVGTARERFVLADVANLRARPAPGARLLAKVPYGTPVDLLAERAGWARVRVDGNEGFAASCLLGERRLDLAALAGLTKQALETDRKRSAAGWAERYVGALRTSDLAGTVEPGKPLPGAEAVRAALASVGAAHRLDDVERWLGGAGRFFVGECAEGDLAILAEYDPSRGLVGRAAAGPVDDEVRGTIGWLRTSPWWGVAEGGDVTLVEPGAWLLDFPEQRWSEPDASGRMEMRYTQVGPCPGSQALFVSAPLRPVKVVPAKAGPDVIAALDWSRLPGEPLDVKVARIDAPGAVWLAVTARFRTGANWPEELTAWQLLARRPGAALAPVAWVGNWAQGFGWASAKPERARFVALGVDGRGLVAIVPEAVQQDGSGSGEHDVVVVVDAGGRAETIHLGRQIEVEPTPDEDEANP